MKKLFLLLAMLAVLCSGVAGDISPLEGVPVLGTPKAEAFETKPVNFVVIDRARSVGKADMRGWIQMVKMDYHVPYYRLMDDNTKANAAVDEMFAKNPKPDKEAMKAAAEQAGCGALVVMVVHRMDSYMVTSHSPFDFGHGDLCKDLCLCGYVCLQFRRQQVYPAVPAGNGPETPGTGGRTLGYH